MPDHCENCDLPKATAEMWAHTHECEAEDCAHGLGHCWGNCEPADWRGRALKAEAELAKLRGAAEEHARLYRSLVKGGLVGQISMRARAVADVCEHIARGEGPDDV